MEDLTKWIIGIFIVVGLAGVIIYGSELAIFREEVYLPEFGSVECAPYPVELYLGSVPREGKSFICGENMYVPPERKCEYNIRKPSMSLVYVYECNADGSNCVKKEGYWSGGGLASAETFHVLITSGKMIKIDPDLREVPEVQLKVISYQLRTVDSGFLSVDPKGCLLTKTKSLLSSLKNDPQEELQTTTYKGEIYMRPDTIYNYVSKLSPSISGNTITLSGVNNGNPIYVYDIGRYYPIEKLETGDLKGELVADTFSPKSSKAIECLPADDYCDSNAKKVSPTEKKCDESMGLTGEYKPTEDINKVCTLKCNTKTGKLDYDQCKTIEQCTPDKPFRDPRTYECVSGIPYPTIGESKEGSNLTPLFIILIIGVIAIIIVLINRGRK